MSELRDERTDPVEAAGGHGGHTVTESEITDREVEIQREAIRSDATLDRDSVHLLPDEAVGELRPRWADIQASFVDDPRRAVEEADTLVADAVKRLSEAFAAARTDMEQEWDRGEEASTEQLRLALQRYRTFFERLLRI